MQAHYEEAADAGHEATVHRGWTELKPCAYTAVDGEPPLDFRQKPADLSRIATCLFGGFRRILGETAFRHELMAGGGLLLLFALIGASPLDFLLQIVLMLVLMVWLVMVWMDDAGWPAL